MPLQESIGANQVPQKSNFLGLYGLSLAVPNSGLTGGAPGYTQ